MLRQTLSLARIDSPREVALEHREEVACLLFSSLLAHAQDAPADDSAIVVGEHLLVVDYNNDGTYRLLLPPELAEPPDETRGVVTWTYDGQESFPLEQLAPGPHPDAGDNSSDPPDPVFDLQRTIRIDRYGRRWRAAEVDTDALVAKVDAYNQEHEPEGGESISYEPEPAGESTYHSWSTATCSGSDYKLWNGEDRVTITPDFDANPPEDLSDRQLTVVGLAKNSDNDLVCSGVMIGEHAVLTAAHCIYGQNVSNHQVCFRGVWRYDHPDEDGYCLEVDSFIPHPDYNGSGDMNVDLGVVILDDFSSFPSSVGVMTVSGAADSTLEALTNANNLAYPGWRDTDPYCYSGTDTDPDGIEGWYMVKDSGPVSHITNKKLGVRIDGGPGHSGSPIYYCPIDDNDVCADGEDGVVIGVWSGWYNGVTTLYNGGPKVPYYQSWILGELP